MRTGVLTPRGRVGDRARAPPARALAPARLAGGPPPRGDRLRGRRARRGRADRHLLRARHPRPRADADDPRRGKGFAEKVLVPLAAHARTATAPSLQLATRNSGLELACGMEHHIEAASDVTVRRERRGRRRAGRRARRPRRRRVAAAVASTSPTTGAARRPHGDLLGRVERTLDRAGAHGYDAIEAEHRAHVADFWRRSDVELEGAPDAPAGRALQPLPADAGDRARRGPRRARQGRDRPRLRGPLLLGHRDLRRAVPCAHDPAVGQAGARLPLRDARRRARARAGDRPRRARSTRGGRSTARRPRPATPPAPRSTTSTPTSPTRCTSTTASPATSTSCSTRAPRCWSRPRASGCELGFFSERRGGRFCINSVTGPDEYTTVVDNNAYTNLMAKENLEIAVRVDRVAAGRRPRRPTPRSCARPGLTAAEVDELAHARPS